MRQRTAARKTVLTESEATLDVAYSNPAQTEVTIACQLAQAGQVVQVQPLPTGQYMYRLLVNSQPVAVP